MPTSGRYSNNQWATTYSTSYGTSSTTTSSASSQLYVSLGSWQRLYFTQEVKWDYEVDEDKGMTLEEEFFARVQSE